MSTDTEIHTYSTPAEIEALLAVWYDDEDQVPQSAEILLQPLNHEVWLDGAYIHDADGDELSAKWITAIATGRPIAVGDLSVTDPTELYMELASGSSIKVVVSAIREIKVGGRRWHQFDDLAWAVVLEDEGAVSVGCQRISREGCEAIVRLIAPHVGLRVVDAEPSTPKAHEWKKGDSVVLARKSTNYADRETRWVPRMDGLVGKTVTVVMVDDKGDVVIEVGESGWWTVPADALDAPTTETPASAAPPASTRTWRVGDRAIVARKDDLWCEDTMNYTLGKEAIVKAIDERDNTVHAEVAGGDWWWYEATSLDPVPA